MLLSSGLYDALLEKQYLIPHKEVTLSDKKTEAWKIVKPETIPFISYPYEWGFSMVKDAALLTLRIQKIALAHGMSLKDASAFNIQFFKGKPILIDTLSFEKYEEGKPWVAYKQFIEHFVAPLALMSMVDIRLNRLTATFLDGIPVELAAKMLPFHAKFNFNLLIHINAHASTQKKFADKKLGSDVKKRRFGKQALLGLIDNLEGTVKGFSWSPKGTQWEDYYEEDKNNYKSESFRHKAELVEQFLVIAKAKKVWDLGANTGFFSGVAKKTGADVLSFDIDYGAIEKNYHDVTRDKEEKVLPLFSDLTNTTPAVGWEGKERMSLFERANADAMLALALIHHLAIGNNVPFAFMAEGFSRLGKYLIIEFIEKDDSQVQILLANRKDIFKEYTKEHFEKAFSAFFQIKKAVSIKGSKRTLYLMEKKGK